MVLGIPEYVRTYPGVVLADSWKYAHGLSSVTDTDRRDTVFCDK